MLTLACKTFVSYLLLIHIFQAKYYDLVSIRTIFYSVKFNDLQIYGECYYRSARKNSPEHKLTLRLFHVDERDD